MILVTGANGLVGSHVCRQLNSKGREFRALVRNGSDQRLLSGIDPSKLIEGDVLDEVSLITALGSTDTVIHCAGFISYDPRKRAKLYQVNVIGTRNVVNAALACGVKKFIHISSVAALARDKGDEVISEKGKWPGTGSNSYYGETKFLAELEVFRGANEGMEVICFNPSIILGPGDPSRSSTRLFDYVLKEKKFYTSGTINYVDLRDLGELILRSTNEQVPGQRFIVNGGKVSYKDFFEMIAQAFNRKAPKVKATNFMIGLSVYIEKFRSLLTGRSPLITRETARSAQDDHWFDNSQVKAEFGIEFRQLQETVEWVRSNLEPDFKKYKIN